MSDRRVKVVFVDQVTWWSLLAVCGLGRSLETIWHFEPITRWSQRWLNVLRRLGLIRAIVRPVNCHIGQVRLETGENPYIQLYGDGRAIALTIKREQLLDDPLINAMGSEWARDKVAVHLQRVVERYVSRECIRIGVVTWMLRTQVRAAAESCAVLIERRRWVPFLQTYAQSRGIRLLAYRGWNPFGGALTAQVLRVLREAGPAFARAIGSVLRRSAVRLRLPALLKRSPSGRPRNAGREGARPTIAIHCWGRTLGFNPTQRSELFFLAGSGIPSSDLLLYDYLTEKPLDAETREELARRGIRLFGQGPGIPVWQPTLKVWTTFLRVIMKLTAAVARHFIRRRQISLDVLHRLAALAWDYAYWYDFYAANGVRVNVTVAAFQTRSGQVLALDALGGVSVGYQLSLSSLIPTDDFSTHGEDIQFVFSAMFEEIWRSIEPPRGRILYTGLIGDHGLQAIHGLERIAAAKETLREHGAQYVLCFFDENSANRWDCWSSDDEAAADYDYLLRWLLDDPTVGVVFKPKKSANLFQRIARVSGLLDQARRTGRCLFLTSDTPVGGIFPAEAALMADVCIGKLAGSTAACEARLAGKPTVLLDADGFRCHPLHAWGRGRVIFEDWDSLRRATERYRMAAENHPEFGDWTPVLDKLDPFQDGQAGTRIGLCVGWIAEALKRGASKETAVATAAARYAQRWLTPQRQPLSADQPLTGSAVCG